VKKILIIEDNDAIRENTAELLELNNYNVFTAEEGNEGFELAKKYSPDLILCDIMMPETDGHRFLKLALNDHLVKDIPLIFFSAGTVPAELQNALTKAADGFLRKPFTEEELLKAVKKFSIYYEQKNCIKVQPD
jgi:CheY-like chemotaxis protein